jgi:organic radical activating enzyme
LLSSFKEKQDELLVHSIFYTIQGEGPFAGRACVFLRLGGCNLGGKDVLGPGCEFCDTSFHVANSKWTNIEDLRDSLDELALKHNMTQALLIVTGGEPLLQYKALGNMLDVMMLRGWEVQMESNGTLFSHLGYDEHAKGFHDNVWNSVHFVISPKALGKPKRVTINPTWRAANTLKFLVCADPQSPYYDLPEEWERHLGEWTLDKYEPNLYISPIAEYVKEPHPADSLITGDTFDREATARNYARAAELIMKHGGIFKLSLQTHLFIGVQ